MTQSDSIIKLQGTIAGVTPTWSSLTINTVRRNAPTNNASYAQFPIGVRPGLRYWQNSPRTHLVFVLSEFPLPLVQPAKCLQLAPCFGHFSGRIGAPELCTMPDIAYVLCCSQFLLTPHWSLQSHSLNRELLFAQD